MGKPSIWRIIISAILFAIVAQVIHGLGANIGMAYYTDPNYFPVWSKIMMPTAGPPPLSFFYYSLGFGLLTALLLAAVYTLLRGAIPGQTLTMKGLVYGFLVFLVGGIPGSLSLYLLVNLPVGLIIGWAIEGLIILEIGGMIIAWINK